MHDFSTLSIVCAFLSNVHMRVKMYVCVCCVSALLVCILQSSIMIRLALARGSVSDLLACVSQLLPETEGGMYFWGNTGFAWFVWCI